MYVFIVLDNVDDIHGMCDMLLLANYVHIHVTCLHLLMCIAR